MRLPAALGLPAFRIYFAARSISSIGSSMTPLAVTFAILRIGGSAGELGLVLASGTIPALLLVLVGGVAGDRWDRRTILVATNLVMAVTQGALAALLLTDRASIWQFVVGELIGGAAMAFGGPTQVGLLPELVPADLLQPANSLLGIASNIASIVGPPIAGILVAVGSPGWALAADSASYLCCAALLVAVSVSRGEVHAGASLLGDLRGGWKAFTSRRWVWLMVASFAVYQATVLPATFVLGPILSLRHFAGASTWALVLSARAVGSLAAGLVVLRWRPNRPLVVSCAVVLLDAPFLLALGAGVPVAVLATAAALAAGGVVAADTVWESTLQSKVPQDLLSRVSSYDWFGSIMINPLGFALIGTVSSRVGAAAVLTATVGVLVVVHVGLLVSRPIRSVTNAPSLNPTG